MKTISSLFIVLFILSCSSEPDLSALKSVLYSDAPSATVKDAVTDMGKRFGSLRMTLEKKIGKKNLTYFLLTSLPSQLRGYEIEFKGKGRERFKNVERKINTDLTFVRMNEIQNHKFKKGSGSFFVDNDCLKAHFLYFQEGDKITRFVIAKAGSENITDGLSVIK